MKFSIIVPTYNNLEYLKCFLDSIYNNSSFEHEIILHINDGSDGTTQYAKENKIKYTYSSNNVGLCTSMNSAYTLASTDHILYSHDDMFFCSNWDKYLATEINNQKDNFYYLTGTMVSTRHGLINYDCGSTFYDFDKIKFQKFCDSDKTPDLQSSHWSPFLIHKQLWDKINGFSEEFNPGDGSDPDLCMKLWKENVRIFKSISKFKVYHFNSKTTRNSKVVLNNGTKTFLFKYGFNPRFFRKYYLRGNISTIPYIGRLTNPIKNIKFYYDLVKCKLKIFYYKVLN
jgi:glycosyltransferase involved in cell wall biosynthesis